MANSALKGCQEFQINDADFNIIRANEWLVQNAQRSGRDIAFFVIPPDAGQDEVLTCGKGMALLPSTAPPG